MPSKKPSIAVRTEEITHKKITYIAEEENRSVSNLCEKLIKDYIKIYEMKNGEIEL